MPLPDPMHATPIPAHPGVGFLRPIAQGRANVSVGAWTCADDPLGVADVFDRRVLHHHDFIGNRPDSGRLCASAEGARCVMGGGSPAMRDFRSRHRRRNPRGRP